MEKEKKNKVWKIPVGDTVLPAEVRYSKKISASAKVLYGDIKALSFKLGYCNAGNDYFAFIYGVDDKTISEWVRQLDTAKFVRSEVLKSYERHIFPKVGKIRVSGENTTHESVKPDNCESPKPDNIVINTDSNINNITAKAELEIFSYKEYLDNIIHGSNRLVAIVAIFAVFKKKIFKDKKSANAFLYSGFNLKYAKDLKDFDDSEIMKAMRKCDAYIIDGRKTDWSLKAVVNAINK